MMGEKVNETYENQAIMVQSKQNADKPESESSEEPNYDYLQAQPNVVIVREI